MKRFLSLMIAVIMVLSMVPTSFATELDGIVIANQGEVIFLDDEADTTDVQAGEEPEEISEVPAETEVVFEELTEMDATFEEVPVDDLVIAEPEEVVEEETPAGDASAEEPADDAVTGEIPAEGETAEGEAEVESGLQDAAAMIQTLSIMPVAEEEGDEIVIATAADLLAVATAVNAGGSYAGKTVKLTADIDLSGTTWSPIGNGARSGSTYTGYAFKGVFDGQSHTISGLTNSLFGIVDGGTVKDVKLKANIDASADSVGAAVAVLCGGGTVSGVAVSGSVKGNESVGGVVGRVLISGTVSGCTNSATVETTGGDAAGGIVGKAYYTANGSEMSISGCTNNGNVTSAYCAGGIVGFSAANVSNCTNSGIVTATDAAAGGIVGEQTNYGTVSGNKNTADISGNEAGGIVGWVRYQKTDAYPLTSTVVVSGNDNTGSVTGALAAGGIVGLVYNQAAVTGNENYASAITATTFAAGIVGGIQSNTDNQTIDGASVTITGNTSTTKAESISAECTNSVAYDNPGSATISGNNTEFVAKIGDVEYATLAEAITAANAGDTILLLTSVDSVPSINKAITIKGAVDGIEINTHIAENFPDIEGTVTFENLTFNDRISTENNSSDQSKMTLKFVGCTFNVKDQYAIQAGSTGTDPDDVLGSLVIENCTFNATSSTYVGNYMVYAQCVNTLKITGSTFNGSNLYKGAIHTGDSIEQATAATISGNKISGFARGVQIGNRVANSTVSVANNTFTGIAVNANESKSGAVYIHGNADSVAKVSVTGNTFDYAAADVTGVLYNDGNEDITSIVPTFSSNALSDGTALYMWSNGTISTEAEVTGPTEIDLLQGSYTITEEGAYTVLAYEGANTLTVKANATITLQGVNINAAADTSAISIESGNVTLTTGAENTLIGGDNGAGIYVAEGAALTIKGGSGKITATGNAGVDDASGAAGIGGTCANGNSGAITIDGANVIAKGYGVHGSGIGSGSGKVVGAINIINNASVTAQGGYYADGAGTKLQTSYGKDDPEGGAAIGGGGKTASTIANITIKDSTVTAYGGSKAAGIGANFWSSCGTITISGGNVNAQGGSSSAGIGTSRAGDTGVSANIVISGGQVTATGGDYGAGIGGGYNADSLGNGADVSALPEISIAISGGTVNATGGEGGAGIGGGYKTDNVDIDITGGIVTASAGALVSGKTVATGGEACAIGSGANGSGVFENSPAVEIGVSASVTATTEYDGKPAIEGMTDEVADALENVTVTVKNAPAPAVAQVGDITYATLAEAVAAAESGATVTLLTNATGAGVVFEDGDNVTIDLNGHTYTLSESVGSSAQYGTVGFYLWAGSNVTVKNGTINMVEDQMGDDDTFFKMFHTYGNLILTDVTLDCTNGVAYNGTTDAGFIAVESDNGTVTINGNTSITKCSTLSPETWTVVAYKNGAVTIDTTGTIDGVVAAYNSTASVTIKGGNFTDSNAKYDQLLSVSSGSIAVSGGTFSEDPSAYLAWGYAASPNADGKYTVAEADAFIITNASEMLEFAAMVNAGKNFAGKTVQLGADIDLSGIEWAPIGGENVYFAGEFDGKNYAIKNLTQTTGARMGLFGLVEKAYIHDLTMENVSFTVTANDARVGAIAGNLQYWNVIENVTINGINITANANDGLIGSVAGYVWKSQLGNVDVKNATITVNGTGNVIGGNTGYGRAHVWDTDVTGNNANWLDGTVQIIDGTEYVLQNYFVNCDVENITIALNGNGSEAGGFFGSDTYNSHSNYFANCHVTGLNVTAAAGTSQTVGGFIAWNNGTTSAGTVKGFDGCSVTGTITGANGTYGGFVGQVGGRACDYTNATANVNITSTGTAGGFVGSTQAYSTHKYTFNNCVATGSVSGAIAGGFAGKNGLSGDGKSVFVEYNDCSASGSVSGSTYAGGLIGEVNTELPATNWNIVDSTGYLTLNSNEASTNVKGNNVVGFLIGYLDGVANGDAKEGNKLSVTLTGNSPDGSDIGTGTGHHINISGDTNPVDLGVVVAQIGETKYATLAEAVTAANAVEDGATVTLLADVTLGEKLTISGNVTISGAYTITRDDAYTGTLFAVNAGATLTLDGGLTIDGGNEWTMDMDAYNADLEAYTKVTDSAKWFTPEEGAPVATAYMITTSGGTVNLNKVTIQNNYSNDTNPSSANNSSGIVSASNGAVVNLTGAKIQHNANVQGSGLVVNASAGVYDVNGNNAIIVTMNDGTVIDGNHVGGNHGVFKVYTGTHFIMNGGEIKNTTGWNSNGNAVGVYWAAFTMNGGTICSNSSVYGPSNGRNAAIYLHSASQFVMNGGTICHNSGRSRGGIDAPYTGEEGNAATAVINGGNVVDNISIYGNSNQDVYGGERLTITGGTYTQDVSQWLAPDTGLVEINGTYTVTDDIAEVNGTVYPSIAAAVEAANAGDTVKVLASHKMQGIVEIIKNITLDLNGKTITAMADDSGYSDAFRILADVTVTGEGTIDADESGYAFFVGNDTTAGKLTIESGNFYGATTAAQVTKGELIIEGGYFQATEYDGAHTYTLNCKDAYYKAGEAKITVKGGTFYKFNPADNAAEGEGTDFVAEGYEAVDNGDGTWGIQQIMVVEMDGVQYASIKDALDTLSGSDTTTHTLKVLKDHEIDVNYSTYNYPILINGFSVVLDLNGKTITADWSKYTGSREDNALIGVVNGGKLTITGNGTIKNSDSHDNAENRIFWMMNSLAEKATILTIENGTFIQEDNIHLLYVQGDNVSTNAGVFTYIKGGNFQLTSYNDFFNAYDGYKQYTELTGGTYNVDPTDWELTIPRGYKVEANDDDTWSVVPDMIFEMHLTDANDEAHWLSPMRGNDINSLIETSKIWYDSLQGTYDFTLKVLKPYEGEGTVVLYETVNVTFPMTLDLNGQTITNAIPETAETFHTIKNESDLTVIDSVGGGAIQSNSAKGYVIYTEGGNLTVDGAKIVGINQGYALVTWTDGDTITIEEGTVVEGRGAVYIDGGATGTINGGTFTMTVQTTNNQDNVVYVGGTSELTINGGTFSTGEITGAQRVAVAAVDSAKVTIKNGSFYGTTDDIAVEDTATVSVEGGTFTGTQLREKVDTSTISLTGGTYSYDPTEWVAEGYVAVDNADGTWKVQPIAGTITDIGRTLSLEGEIYINQYVTVEGFDGLDIEKNGGLLVWYADKHTDLTEEAALYGSQDVDVAGLEASGTMYTQQSPGFAAPQYADEVYLRVYVRLADDSYVYSPLKEYSVQRYCENTAKNSGNNALINVCNSILHFGAAAQINFNYNVNDLANIKAGEIMEYNASMLDALDEFTTNIVASELVENIGRTLSLESAVLVNQYFRINSDVDVASAELLVWDGVSDELTVDNVSYTVALSLSDGMYKASTKMFASAEFDKTVFLCGRFTDKDGHVYYSTVKAYSPDTYAKNVIQNSSASEALVKTMKQMVVYGEYADVYFGV